MYQNFKQVSSVKIKVHTYIMWPNWANILGKKLICQTSNKARRFELISR